MSAFSQRMAARQAARAGDGRYTEMSRYEPTGIDLTLPDVFEGRRKELAAGGYVAAIASVTHIDPKRTEHRAEWWDEQFATGEYGHDDGSVPKLPDDNTPKQTGGLALSGNRRTHRVKYEGSGVAVRMPSATAVRRYQSESGHRTFDVPVSVTRPDGSQVAGWVRVSGEGRTWNAKALGFTGSDQAAISEAVASILEARQPTFALRHAGNLLEKHRQRLAEQGAEPQKVTSSWVTAVAFDSVKQQMYMQTGGRVYSYRTRRETFDQVRTSEAPGRVMNQVKKMCVGGDRVSECGKCGRLYTTQVHTCPPPAAKRLVVDPYAEITRARIAGRRVGA